MPPSDISTSKDMSEQIALLPPTAQIFPSNTEMSQFGKIISADKSGASLMLPEFHIDTTDIYAPPTIQMPQQVDCSRYEVVAANPSCHESIKSAA
ncbi:hypothetical protein BH11CYA1_BH11CYA1_10320 [soil metagenome]